MRPSSLVERHTNEHGWINYKDLNDELKSFGIIVNRGDFHNYSDGEVHFIYEAPTGNTLDFRGNYWNGSSFREVGEWVAEELEANPPC